MLRGERVARNQVLRRFVNEQIRNAAEQFVDPDEAPEPMYEFTCECASRRCVEQVKMSISEYERVRANATAFVVAPGHEVSSIERVVRSSPRYRVVVKFHPEPIRFAVAEDPRQEPR